MSFQNYGICAKCGIPRTGPNQPSCLRCGTLFEIPVSKPATKAAPVKAEPTAFVPPPNWGLPTNVKRQKKRLPLKMILVVGLIAGLVIAGFFLLSQVLSGSPSTSPTVQPTLSPLITPSPTPSGPGGIVVIPATLDCQNPETSTTTITLPATVLATAQVTEMLDGKNAGSFKVSSFTHQPDGTWVAKSSRPAAEMAAACANSGINPKSGAASFTDGLHVLQIIDAKQLVLADGSYTVSNPTAVTSPQPTPSINISGDPYAAAFATGATAICGDGSLSFAANRKGACSNHNGVAWWTGLVGGPAGPGPAASSLPSN
jgi:hypothetical protein